MTGASVIISFYNKIDYLKAVLAGFERQTHKKFEILIADDGSKASVVDEVKKIIASFTFNDKTCLACGQRMAKK